MNKPSLTIRPNNTGVRERIPVIQCEHKYIHFDTNKKQERSGPYQTCYKRIDLFYCEKCCHEKTVTSEEYSRDKPDWY